MTDLPPEAKLVKIVSCPRCKEVKFRVMAVPASSPEVWTFRNVPEPGEHRRLCAVCGTTLTAREVS